MSQETLWRWCSCEQDGYDGANSTALSDPDRMKGGDAHGSLRLVGWHEFKALIGRPGDRSADDPNGFIPTGVEILIFPDCPYISSSSSYGLSAFGEVRGVAGW